MERTGGNHSRTHHWLSDAVPGRSDRRKAEECNGDCKDELWTEGSILFAVLNVLQLVGWTAIMIYDGALAADGVLHTGNWVWAVIIWCFDHCVDFYWTDQSWQIKYGCHDSTFYFITGTFLK